MEFRGKYLVLAVYRPYRLDYSVWFFTNVLSLAEIRSSIGRILEHAKVEDVEPKDLAYIGVEELPFEGEGYAAVLFNIGLFGYADKVKKVDVSIPREVQERLRRYRERRLTIDIDSSFFDDYKIDIDIEAGHATYMLYKKFSTSNIKVVKTRRGYHVVAELPEPVPIPVQLLYRKELGDDKWRLEFDKLLVESGLDFLTGILFDYKWWSNERGFHRWQEASPITAIPLHSFKLPDNTVINLKKGRLVFASRREQQYAVFYGYAPEEAERILQKLAQKLSDRTSF
jgi:hypothetical protein